MKVQLPVNAIRLQLGVRYNIVIIKTIAVFFMLTAGIGIQSYMCRATTSYSGYITVHTWSSKIIFPTTTKPPIVPIDMHRIIENEMINRVMTRDGSRGSLVITLQYSFSHAPESSPPNWPMTSHARIHDRWALLLSPPLKLVNTNMIKYGATSTTSATRYTNKRMAVCG